MFPLVSIANKTSPSQSGAGVSNWAAEIGLASTEEEEASRRAGGGHLLRQREANERRK